MEALDKVAKAIDYMREKNDKVAMVIDCVRETVNYMAETIDYIWERNDKVAKTVDYMRERNDKVAEIINYVRETVNYMAKAKPISKTLSWECNLKSGKTNSKIPKHLHWQTKSKRQKAMKTGIAERNCN